MHSGTFVGQNAAKDEAGLLGKLNFDPAATKLDQGKFQDALTAPTQFRDKVSALDARDNIASADARVLIAGATNCVVCVESLVVELRRAGDEWGLQPPRCWERTDSAAGRQEASFAAQGRWSGARRSRGLQMAL
ncbi:MAG: hypothetical protein ACJ789_01395 [Thermomicrobiales bacterium]